MCETRMPIQVRAPGWGVVSCGRGLGWEAEGGGAGCGVGLLKTVTTLVK